MAWKYIYWTCRTREFWKVDLQDISLNGRYTTEFFNEGQFKDFADANITKLSMPIPNSKYTGVLPVIDENEQPTGETVPKLTRFVMLKYSDIYTTAEDLTTSIEKSWWDTNVVVFTTPAEAIQWIKDNTDLVELSTWVFEITPAYVDEMTWLDVEQKTLTII